MLVTDLANERVNDHSPEGAWLNLSRDDRIPNIMASIYLVALVKKPTFKTELHHFRGTVACSGFSTNLISHVCYKRWTTLPVLISGSSAELRNTKCSKITRHHNGHPLQRSVSCMDQMLHCISLCILSIQCFYGFGTVPQIFCRPVWYPKI